MDLEVDLSDSVMIVDILPASLAIDTEETREQVAAMRSRLEDGVAIPNKATQTDLDDEVAPCENAEHDEILANLRRAMERDSKDEAELKGAEVTAYVLELSQRRRHSITLPPSLQVQRILGTNGPRCHYELLHQQLRGFVVACDAVKSLIVRDSLHE